MTALFDQAVAKSVLPVAAWAYYSSGADDEVTMRENRSAYQRIWLRPRILRDVTEVDFSSKILGHATTLPMYITATALGELISSATGQVGRSADCLSTHEQVNWVTLMERRT